MKINTIPESRKYLWAFILSRRNQYLQDAREFTPFQGYGEFHNSDKIVKCMRIIATTLNNRYSGLSIPGDFNTPENLIKTSEEFIKHLVSYSKYFDESITTYKNSKELIPDPIRYINRNRQDVIEAFTHFIKYAKAELTDSLNNINDIQQPILIIENIFKKIRIVANQLKNRYDNRPTLIINDEYDVQDLLHALLKLFFDDIRPEEWNPSYAGSSSRCDFLLKNEKIVIETKKTRPNLSDRKIGNDLIIDKAHYKVHPDCKTLLCFIFDPDFNIKNPSGIENDLRVSENDFTVKVYVIQ